MPSAPITLASATSAERRRFTTPTFVGWRPGPNSDLREQDAALAAPLNGAIVGTAGQAVPAARRPFLVSTDWGLDRDDVAAMAVLAYNHKIRAIDLRGVCLSTRPPTGIESLDGFLRAEGVVPEMGPDPRREHRPGPAPAATRTSCGSGPRTATSRACGTPPPSTAPCSRLPRTTPSRS